ncbi:hypothetical protein [Nitrincola alkalisediminis]|uniref:hypothetical protein n=1 Tax=Nitrincola alkalisediminis TaxID=1366656 RepID=UPI0018747EB7|nr:hypothetical protein [Nitrincola alkalisediminis]
MITNTYIFRFALDKKIIPSVALGLCLGFHTAFATEMPERFVPAVLPIERVVLSTSGVALFQQGGKVDGQVEVQLQANTSEMNDLLKSLVYWDQGQGRIVGVRYPGQSALERILSGLALDLSNNPGWVDILTQLRGQEITLEQTSGATLTARVLGADRRTVRIGDQWLELDYLNLVSDTGLESIQLDQIRRFELTDVRLQSDLSRALSALAQDRQSERKRVSLYLAGEGEREVAITYIAEAPIWKTSYRLLLSEGNTQEAASLQTWALVENTSDQDWHEISLALISGRPLSFIEDLYQSRFIERPVHESVAFQSIVPQTYALARGAAADTVIAEGVMPLAMYAPSPAPAPAPSSSPSPKAGGIDNVGGADVGTHFEYRLDNVTLPRQQSAMLPILNAQVEITPVSIYDAQVHAKHPLRGARVRNLSDKPLPEGPMTVMMGQSYVGDARIDHIPAGAERMISYAVDLDVQVQRDGQQYDTQLTQGRVEKGMLILQKTRQRETIYHATNESAQQRDLMVLHPRHADWQLANQAYALDETEQHYRVTLDLEAQSEQRLIVKETRVDWERIQLGPLNEAQLLYWSTQGAIAADTKAKLAEAAALRQAWSRAEQVLADVEHPIARIYEEQARIRANLEVLEAGSSLYVRLVDRLNLQENQLEQLEAQLLTAQSDVQKARSTFEDYIAGL